MALALRALALGLGAVGGVRAGVRATLSSLSQSNKCLNLRHFPQSLICSLIQSQFGPPNVRYSIERSHAEVGENVSGVRMSTPLGRICRRGVLVIAAFASGLPAPSLWHFGDVAQAHESHAADSVAGNAYRESTQHMASRISQLMGQRVQLPLRGDVIVRQSLAPNGRVMKQLLLSRDLSELQLDENSDGVMDLWEVKKGFLTVTASDPLGGQFMRLTISDKVKDGILEAEYLLSRDGREYALWRAKIDRTKIMHWEGENGADVNQSHDSRSDRRYLVADASRSTRELVDRVLRRPSPTPALASTPVPRVFREATIGSALMDTRPVSAMRREEVSAQAQECSEFVGPMLANQAQRCEQLIREWRNFGDYIGIGSDMLCDLNPDNQLARLQVSWWNVLQQMNGQESLLARLRNTIDPDKSMFANTCYSPDRRQEFERLTAGLAEVMGTSAGLDRTLVQPGSTPNPSAPRSLRDRQGPFLACLERNGLATTAARIEREFYMALEFPHLNTNRPLSCQYSETQGAQNPGSYVPGHNQIQIRMTASQEGRHQDHEGTPQTYANVLFHEYIHAAGIGSEPFTHTAVACCGNPPGSNPSQACDRLRGMVNEELRVKQLEALFGPNVHNADSVYNYIQGRYGPEVADRMSREFLLGLDREGGIVSGYGKIMDPEALRACVAREGQEACVQKWVEATRNYLGRFTENTCPSIISWSYRDDVTVNPEVELPRQCRSIQEKIQTELESGMRRMIQGTAAGQCRPTETRAGLIDATRWISAIFGAMPVAEATNAAAPDPCAYADQRPQPGYTEPPSTNPGQAAPIPIPRPNTGQHGDGNNRDVISTPGSGQTSRNQVDTMIPPSTSRDRLARYNQLPSSDVSRIAPRPVTRIDTESRQGLASVERRLREATDFVGAATRGLDRLKSVAIPTAQASERGSASRISSANTNYVPFRAPMRSLENGGRLPSSLPASDQSGAIEGATVRTASSGQRVVGKGTGSGLSHSTSAPFAPGAAGTSGPTNVDGSGQTIGPTLPPGHLGVREQDPRRVPAAGSSVQVDLLAPVLSRPWREIASNLKSAVVVQALVDQRIVIVDPSGRRIGSRVPTRTYRFIDLDKPLKLDQRVPASRP